MVGACRGDGMSCCKKRAASRCAGSAKVMKLHGDGRAGAHDCAALGKLMIVLRDVRVEQPNMLVCDMHKQEPPRKSSACRDCCAQAAKRAAEKKIFASRGEKMLRGDACGRAAIWCGGCGALGGVGSAAARVTAARAIVWWSPAFLYLKVSQPATTRQQALAGGSLGSPAPP